MVNQKRLFEQFPPVSTTVWMDKITTDLKGADFADKLVWKTREGFSVMPFYRMEDLDKIKYTAAFLPLFLRREIPADNQNTGLQTLTGRGAKLNNSWLIRQDIRVSDYSSANRKALSILMKGIDSVGFIISDPGSISEENFRVLLNGINPGNAELNFVSNGKAKEILDLLFRISETNGYAPSKIYGVIETDPLGRLMTNGTLCIPVEDGFEYLASLTRQSQALPHFRNLQVNGSYFTNAGADAVQEVGFTISMAVEYLAKLTELDLKPDEAAKKIRFSFGTGSNYFMEIAKLRAARILWALIADGYGPVEDNSWRMEIHSTTCKWNTTVYDPYVNMLRTQTEAMSAVLGGTDSLTVNPFDSAFREAGEFSERIARNQQLILKEEACFSKVADPAAGSYYIENLTALIAENSWKLFLETENRGGFLAALRSGFIREKVAESGAKLKSDIARCQVVLTGTNKFPDLNEKISPEVNPDFGTDVTDTNKSLDFEPVKPFRGSEDLEKIRIAADKAPERPSVCLLKIGNKAKAKARSRFSAGFFGCAGYRIIKNKSFNNIDDAVKTALDSKAKIVVICSSDEEYRLFAHKIFDRINGKAIVVIAGYPVSINFLKSKGLENFIHINSNLVETLKLYNSKIGL